jgi:hypothetical protein
LGAGASEGIAGTTDAGIEIELSSTPGVTTAGALRKKERARNHTENIPITQVMMMIDPDTIQKTSRYL